MAAEISDILIAWTQDWRKGLFDVICSRGSPVFQLIVQMLLKGEFEILGFAILGIIQKNTVSLCHAGKEGCKEERFVAAFYSAHASADSI